MTVDMKYLQKPRSVETFSAKFEALEGNHAVSFRISTKRALFSNPA
jgi:hypothetical protein